MAKKFAGFKQEAMEKKILPALGYTGPMDQKSVNAFLASNPGAAAKMGRYTLAARQRIEGVKGMAYGGMATKKGYAVGGSVPYPLQDAAASGSDTVAQNASMQQLPSYMNPGLFELPMSDTYKVQDTDLNQLTRRDLPSPQIRPKPITDYDTSTADVIAKRNALSAAQQAAAQNPEDEALKKAMEDAQIELTRSQAAESQARANLAELSRGDAKTAEALLDPGAMVKTADVETVTAAEKAAGTIATDAGDAGTATTATGTTATAADAVTGPADMTAATFDATAVSDDVKSTLDKISAATGKPSDEALAEAATMKPGDLAALGLTVEQIAEARKVVAPAPRKVEAGEMIEGSTVDMERVKKETNFEAATGAPSTDATVQGQLTGLMMQFEGSEPPAWAAGAMRAAAAQMAARGLSASSMAGQAAIQAAMESAMPIAVQDAQTSATFELTNLSNKQQSAMFAAEKRAEFLGLEFNQNFQARVANASKISEIANMNFTAEQQVALENARMAQSVDLANLSAANAKVMADAAAMTQLDLTNLNNRQQAQVQNAKSFLDMDMVNLSNEQQATMFKSQSLVNALLSDQAAENAAKQFNASSENQTNQFFTNLASQVSMFNNEQKNAMNQFNSGQTNAVNQFNVSQRAARDQFNANNQLIVAQANAAWSQAITTAETAAQNEANRDAAIAENQYTMTAYNNVIQEERDMISYAFSAAESTADRQVRLQVAAIQAETAASQIQAQIDTAAGAGSGKLLAAFADKALDWAFG